MCWGLGTLQTPAPLCVQYRESEQKRILDVRVYLIFRTQAGLVALGLSITLHLHIFKFHMRLADVN